MRIGVLALQGGFAEHVAALEKLGAAAFEIRKQGDLDRVIDGLVIPGGESTVIRRLLRGTGLYAPLKALIDGGLPVFGTCAGMILLAETVENDFKVVNGLNAEFGPTIENTTAVSFGSMGITVRRNAFGRQLGSFHTEDVFLGVGRVPMTFIRAPQIVSIQDGVTVLAEVNGIQVAAESKNILVTAFHPELTDDLRVHRYFLDKIH